MRCYLTRGAEGSPRVPPTSDPPAGRLAQRGARGLGRTGLPGTPPAPARSQPESRGPPTDGLRALSSAGQTRVGCTLALRLVAGRPGQWHCRCTCPEQGPSQRVSCSAPTSRSLQEHLPWQPQENRPASPHVGAAVPGPPERPPGCGPGAGEEGRRGALLLATLGLDRWSALFFSSLSSPADFFGSLYSAQGSGGLSGDPFGAEL